MQLGCYLTVKVFAFSSKPQKNQIKMNIGRYFLVFTTILTILMCVTTPVDCGTKTSMFGSFLEKLGGKRSIQQFYTLSSTKF